MNPSENCESTFFIHLALCKASSRDWPVYRRIRCYMSLLSIKYQVVLNCAAPNRKSNKSHYPLYQVTLSISWATWAYHIQALEWTFFSADSSPMVVAISFLFKFSRAGFEESKDPFILGALLTDFIVCFLHEINKIFRRSLIHDHSTTKQFQGLKNIFWKFKVRFK